MGAVDRRTELRELLAGVLARRTQSELGALYGYDIGPAVVPGPKGAVAGYVVIISTGSAALTPRLAAAHFIGDAWPALQLLDDAVRVCLAAIDQQRKPVPAAAGNVSRTGLFHG